MNKHLISNISKDNKCTYFNITKSYKSYGCSLIILILSAIAQSYNAINTQYSGNQYIPNNIGLSYVIIFLILTGIAILHPSQKHLNSSTLKDNNLVLSVQTKILRLVYFIITINIIAYATNSVQYTPFNPVDYQIIKLENFFHINLLELMIIPNLTPLTYQFFAFIYDSLTYMLVIIPLFLIIFSDNNNFERFIFMLLASCLIGFLIYYFLPTTGPASNLKNAHFTVYQHATGLKFREIHNHLMPSTSEGGLIALPSFHAIWAIILTLATKPWKWLYYIMITWCGIVCVSCIVIGWHYPTDIILSYLLMNIIKRRI